MADSSVAVTPGAGANIDTRTVTGGDHRQVMVLGDETATTCAPVDAAGVHTHAGRTSSGTTPARVSGAVTSTQLLASNTARLGVVIHNDSTASLWVKYGTAASTTSYVYKLAAGAHLSLPEPGQPLYTGVIHGIWDVATGAATVNELT